jgi:hypothetical protein
LGVETARAFETVWCSHTTNPEEVVTHHTVCYGAGKINATIRLQFGIDGCAEGVLLYAGAFQLSPRNEHHYGNDAIP